MQNLILTQLTIPEVREIFQEEISSFFNKHFPNQSKETQDVIGDISLAMEITGLAKPTIYSLVSDRKIPHSKQSGKLYFNKKELLDWIASGRRKTTTEIQQDAETFVNNSSKFKQ